MYKKNIKRFRKKTKKRKEPGYLLHPKWAFYPQLCIYWLDVLKELQSEHFYVSVSRFQRRLLPPQVVLTTV